MFLFENTVCPVCQRTFAEDDDIVVCPECGTPHHRACYTLTGKCVNSGLHAAGYRFPREQSRSASGSHDSVSVPAPQTETAEADDGGAPAAPEELLHRLVLGYRTSDETIGNRKAGDIATAVGTNVPRFIAVFRRMESRGNKLGWNWGAFFFGSLYFFYRKMYRYAISLISLVIAVITASDLLLTKLAPKAVEALQQAAMLGAGKDTEAMNAQMLQFQQAPDIGKALLVSYLTVAVFLLIRVFEALTADYFYKKTVFRLIDSADITEEDVSFFPSPFSEGDEMQLGEEQLRKLYLTKKGGVSLFAPFAAFALVYMILSLI